MCDVKFYHCRHCGNLIGLIHASGVPVVCCGEPMTQLVPNTVDASQEKHVPVIKAEGNSVKVSVGTAAHPMTQEHHIAWVYIQTSLGGQRKCLAAGGAPETEFCLTEGEKLVAAYAYCNLHGLWMAEA